MANRANLAIVGAGAFAAGVIATTLWLGRYTDSAGAGAYSWRLDRLTGETVLCNVRGCRTPADASRADTEGWTVVTPSAATHDAPNDLSGMQR